MILFPWQLERKLNEILWLLKSVKREEVILMATLDEALAKVTEQTTVLDSLDALAYQIKGMLDAALSKDLTPAQQAKVDAIFSGLSANMDKAAKAVLDNTPQAPTP